MITPKYTRLDKRQETKERIFGVAVELFLKQGYEQTTVQEITEKANVAKGTFFNHFPTKESILFYLGQQRVMYMEERIQHEVGEPLTAKEKLARILGLFTEIDEQNKALTALVMREMIKLQVSNTASVIVEEKEERLKEAFLQIIREGQQAGELRPNIHAEQALDIIFSMYFFTLFRWLETDFGQSLTEEVAERLELIMNGLS